MDEHPVFQSLPEGVLVYTRLMGFSPVVFKFMSYDLGNWQRNAVMHLSKIGNLGDECDYHPLSLYCMYDTLHFTTTGPSVGILHCVHGGMVLREVRGIPTWIVKMIEDTRHGR